MITKPKVTEHQLQAAIVESLVLAGFQVKHTTAYRQKGASGMSKGIPDLLVSHRAWPRVYLGLEVKTSTGALTHEQRVAVAFGEYTIVRTPIDAVRTATAWACNSPAISSADFLRMERAMRSLGGSP